MKYTIHIIYRIYQYAHETVSFNNESMYVSAGDICRNGNKLSPDYICRQFSNCISAQEAIRNNVKPQLCSFKGSVPIVCCSPTSNVTTPIISEKPRPPVSAVKAHSAAKSTLDTYNIGSILKKKKTIIEPTVSNTVGNIIYNYYYAYWCVLLCKCATSILN